MPAIAEVRIPMTLDKERILIFNLNTMAAYEEITRKDGAEKFYFDTLMDLYEKLSEETSGAKPADTGASRPAARVLSAVRRLPMSDLRNLLWAAAHEYDAHDRPRWPLTREQIGRYLVLTDMPRVLNLIVQGHLANSPSKSEVGEAAGAGPVASPPAVQDPTPPANGGAAPTGLQEEDFK